MEFNQKRNSNRVRYAFGEDEFQYSIEDGSGSRSFSVGYTEISRDRQTFVERNQWLRNVGLLWLALGAVLSVMNVISEKGDVSIWLWVGAACYLFYRIRTTRFTVVPSEKGNLLIIDDADGKRILEEMESRRADHFRREFDFMPESDTPDQHRKRFKWLHREGVLNDADLAARLAAVDAIDPTRLEGNGPASGTLLN